MAICKCEACGFDLEIPTGASVVACGRCGAVQTVPDAAEETMRGAGDPWSGERQGPFAGEKKPTRNGSYDPYATTQAATRDHPFPWDAPQENTVAPPKEKAADGGGKGSRKRRRIIVTAVAAALFLVAVVVGLGAARKGGRPDRPDPQSGTAETSAAAAQQTPEAADEAAAAETAVPGVSEQATEAPAEASQDPQPTAAPVPETAAPSGGGGENAPSNQLFRPSAGDTVDGYPAYVFCVDKDVQDYVKMRLGPDKTKFEVTGSHIPNYESVTVKSSPVNGWCFCDYHGQVGWIRSDFLFRDMNHIVSQLESGDKMPAGIYQIDIDDPAAGSVLNVRAEPAQEAALVASLPNGAFVNVPCDAVITRSRVYAVGMDRYSDVSGYILMDYLVFIEGDAGDKPVLYLYPEQETDVDVTVRLAKGICFTCTYPAYRDGWRVTASPDGALTDRDTGREYSCLYWELGGRAEYDFSAGFVVKGGDTAAFLEEKLTELGLSVRERNEFIVYWLPRMQNNPYNLISFQTEAYTSLVDLQITPAPDSLLRVFMAYKPLREYTEIAPQIFPRFERRGFTAVEWGGVECLY